MRHGKIILEPRGDVLIKGIWEIKPDAIIDIRFRDADADTYATKGMDTLLPRREQINMDKHRRIYYEEQIHFFLFVL